MSVMEQIAASSIGGIITALVVTPFDVVKTRLQAQSHPKHTEHHTTTKSASKTVYRGTIDAFSKISKYEGITAFWRGVGPSLVMTVPATTIYFTLYENLKFGLQQYRDFGLFDTLVAGMLARAVTVFMTTPVDLLRTNVQSHGRSVAPFQLFADIVRTRRLSTFWTGLRPSLWRDVPFSGLYWVCYDFLRYNLLALPSRSKDSSSRFALNLAAGAIAGGVAAAATMPFDVLKTRAQMDVDRIAKGEISKSQSCLNKSIPRQLFEVYQKEGVRSLFQGVLPRLVKVAPACAIMISSYELMKDFFISRRRIAASTGSL